MSNQWVENSTIYPGLRCTDEVPDSIPIFRRMKVVSQTPLHSVSRNYTPHPDSNSLSETPQRLFATPISRVHGPFPRPNILSCFYHTPLPREQPATRGRLGVSIYNNNNNTSLSTTKTVLPSFGIDTQSDFKINYGSHTSIHCSLTKYVCKISAKQSLDTGLISTSFTPISMNWRVVSAHVSAVIAKITST